MPLRPCWRSGFMEGLRYFPSKLWLFSDLEGRLRTNSLTLSHHEPTHPSLSSPFLHSLQSLSDSQARGFIRAYNLTVFYSNGSELQMSTAEPNRQYVHEIVEQLCSNGTTKWFLNATLKDVSSVSIIAYNSKGATKESFLTISTTGKRLCRLS